VVGVQTWIALKTKLLPGNRVLRLGNTGRDVYELQGLLQVLGHAVPRTGNFDAATEQAVIAFQRKHKLVDSGLVNRVTWTVLRGKPLPPELPQQTGWLVDLNKWW
jgi:peptidoglycan hydrolase-like protein with peptidoglycan-binding domain